MKTKKITKNTFKFVLSLFTFLYGVVGLVISSICFSRDYVGFMEQTNDAQQFWIGFVVLCAIIISGTLILIGFGIMFVTFIKWWNKRQANDDEGE